MTSSASSVPDASPALAALLCTHKRGAAVALFPVPAGLPSREGLRAAVQEAAQVLRQSASREPVPFTLDQTSASGLCHSFSSMHFASCSGMTAENLAQLFKWILARSGSSASPLKTIGVVVGLGSFTGLRLGCAFANGLCVGEQRELWAIEIPPAEQWNDRLADLPHDCHAAFCSPESGDADDPYATGTGFSDIYIALKQWQDGGALLVDVLEPHYGREPTPVLKLKKELESHSS